MQMRPGDAAGGTDRAYELALLYPLTFLNGDFAHVQISADQSLAMVQKNAVAVEEVIAGADHCGRGGGQDIAAGYGGDVQAIMRLSWLIVKKAFQSKQAAQPAIDRG